MPHWIHSPPEELYTKGEFHCQFRFQHVHPRIDCRIELTEENSLKVETERPLRALTPGQYAVFYVGDETIGSAQIVQSGPSMQELESMGHSLEDFKNMDLSGSLGC